jgi:sugar phosphate isomerase/epimerase
MSHTGLPRRTFLAAAGAGIGMLATSRLIAAQAPPEPKFRLGIVTYNVAAEWDVPTILKVCKEVGLAAVELRTTHKHGVEPTLSKEQRADVRKRFADAGVTLWGLGTVCEFHSTDATIREKNVETCKQFLQLAADLGAKGVKVRPNGLHRTVRPEETLEVIGKSLTQCGNAAADLGQEVWVEVHGPGTSQPARMRTIMEMSGHPSVGITWNSNKEDIQNGSVRPAFELLKPWIRSCHINALYSGYPYRELFTCLRENGYDRFTLVEIPERVDPVNGALLLKYYKALWRELCHG